MAFIPNFFCGALFVALVAFQSKSEAPELTFIEKRLSQELIAHYPSVRLAQSHNTDLTKQQRIESINTRIVTELDTLLLDLKSSSPSDLIESVISYVRTSVDRQLARTGYAVQFQGGHSVLAIERQLAFLRVKSRDAKDTAKQVISLISSYERTAQPGEELEEYPNAKQLQAKEARRTVGSENFFEISQPALVAAQPVALRKCRLYPGRLHNDTICLTSLYEVQVFGERSESEALIEVLLNPFFKADRSEFKVMVPDGLTSVYLVRQFHDIVFIYKVSMRYSEVPWPNLDERTLTASLIEEDYKNLLRRIEFEIKKHDLPWEIVRWQQHQN